MTRTLQLVQTNRQRVMSKVMHISAPCTVNQLNFTARKFHVWPFLGDINRINNTNRINNRLINHAN